MANGVFLGRIAIGLAVMSACSAWPFFAASASEEASNAKEHRVYNQSAQILCGKTIVALTSTCFKDEDKEDFPYCPNQVVTFLNPADLTAQTIFYEHKFRQGSQDYLTGIDCEVLKEGRFVVLQGTNFSSCDTCEWIDVFDIRGRFIGTNGEGKDHGFPSKRIDPELAKRLYAAPSGATATIGR